MLLVQLGINSTRDVWKFSKLDSPRRLDITRTTRKYMHAETLALLTKPLYFPNMKYLK
jgi:hypothetical protein